MFDRLQKYGRFIKIEHSVFAFPLLIAGGLLAAGREVAPHSPLGRHETPWTIGLALILCAGIGARTVAFTFNRVLDARFDRLNPRTSQREIPAGKMTLAEAGGVGFAGAIVYFSAAYALLKSRGVLLGLIPIAVFGIYPLLKRFTSLAHLGVGLSLALAPIGGWIAFAALRGVSYPGFPQLLYLALFTFFWVSGFDIIYSTLDEDFDRDEGLHSLPAKWGRRKALWISSALHFAAFVTLGVLYLSYFLTPVAGVLLSVTGVFLFLEQYLSEDVNLAFFKINGVISFLILAFVWAGVEGL